MHFDSNILIDLLNGIDKAMLAFDQPAPRFVSVVARAEVVAGLKNDVMQTGAAALFRQCRFVDVDIGIADAAAALRRAYRIKLPDALIAATAQLLGQTLMTRDDDLLRLGDFVTVPYRLD